MRAFADKVSRSTLADANRAHDWRIFADFAQVLIGRARKLYADEPSAWSWSRPFMPSTPRRSISA